MQKLKALHCKVVDQNAVGNELDWQCSETCKQCNAITGRTCKQLLLNGDMSMSTYNNSSYTDTG